MTPITTDNSTEEAKVTMMTMTRAPALKVPESSARHSRVISAIYQHVINIQFYKSSEYFTTTILESLCNKIKIRKYTLLWPNKPNKY